jgi:hypothetical protein
MQISREEVVLRFMVALCTKEYFYPELIRTQAEIMADSFFKTIKLGEKE